MPKKLGTAGLRHYPPSFEGKGHLVDVTGTGVSRVGQVAKSLVKVQLKSKLGSSKWQIFFSQAVGTFDVSNDK